MTAAFLLLTTILLLFPLEYLFIACPAFLLVRLSIPKVRCCCAPCSGATSGC